MSAAGEPSGGWATPPTTVLRCPVGHESSDPSAQRRIVADWAGATSWQHVVESLIAEGLCPACPTQFLDAGSAVLYGYTRDTGTCPCCGAVWLMGDATGWTGLNTGRLVATGSNHTG